MSIFRLNFLKRKTLNSFNVNKGSISWEFNNFPLETCSVGAEGKFSHWKFNRSFGNFKRKYLKKNFNDLCRSCSYPIRSHILWMCFHIEHFIINYFENKSSHGGTCAKQHEHTFLIYKTALIFTTNEKFSTSK